MPAEIARAEAWFADQDGALAEAFGRFHAGLTTDWRALFAALEWAGAYLALYGGAAVPAGARLLACDTEAGAARAQTGARGGEMTALLADVRAEIAFARGVLPERALIAPAATADDATVSALRERVVFHLENLHCLERWLRCARQRALCAGLGLGGLLDAALRERPFPRDLVARFDKRFYQLWLDGVLRQAPELQSFAGDAHEQTIQRFRDLDEDHIRQAQRRTHARLAERRRAGILAVRGDTMGALAWAFTALRKEVAKKRHPSIRQIVRATGPALLTLKPCWMMSPLSVSQFMDTAEPLFDVVIFDEASQVCPEDAICAILRGAQLIVVGDPKQLPPTRFFAKSLGDDEDEDDEDGATAEASARAERTESILNECLGVDFPQRRLRWHYRSRHESLIAFSNAHFYDDNLYTFPSPDARHDDGVRFVHVADGVYDRGGRRTNVREAQRVVDLVVEHFQRYSTDRSLGVVALSRAQEDAIRDEITARRKRDRTLDGWGDELDENNDGGFFVKNLESVQGDERDVIILSIGYGRDATGRSPSTNFGPVNKAGGERRLNVAVTRAKHQLVVVSSMRADDLPAGLSNPGARTLRAYLEYAERGPDVLPAQTRASGASRAATVGAAPESPFEAAVYAALSAKGLALDCQVGCSGYRIDLAVRDPRQPGRYLLGIECDGATYHSSATARDRDRLRQRHLERMGWHIHRIWSRDWVRDPAREVARVVAAVEESQVDGVAYLEPVAVAAGGASASARALSQRTALIPASRAARCPRCPRRNIRRCASSLPLRNHQPCHVPPARHPCAWFPWMDRRQPRGRVRPVPSSRRRRVPDFIAGAKPSICRVTRAEKHPPVRCGGGCHTTPHPRCDRLAELRPRRRSRHDKLDAANRAAHEDFFDAMHIRFAAGRALTSAAGATRGGTGPRRRARWRTSVSRRPSPAAPAPASARGRRRGVARDPAHHAGRRACSRRS